MRRYFLQISYNGTNYHGWQIQPNASSVQEVMEKALSTVLREEISVVGAGRTDTGVHASFYMLHFDSENENLQNENLVFRLNRFLPDDIAVQQIFPVKPDVHARYNAVSRTYKYFISTVKNPFETSTAYQYTLPLDVNKMNEVATVLFEYRDFSSFSKLHTDVKTNNCNIMLAEWRPEGDRIVFTIKADRFLRNMVRAIVGTLLEAGKGKLSKDGLRNIIEEKNRGKAGVSVPAHGLFLVDVEYPEELFEV
ncbi:MAG: tRNA pseudouridine(38-40) synthase TruA [Draconibacterium sp.]